MQVLSVVICFLLGGGVFFASHLEAAESAIKERKKSAAPTYSDYQKRSTPEYKKMGVGFSAAGALGLVGVNLAINFTPKYSLVGGFGGGLGYWSYAFQLKRTFGYQGFEPYISLGFANWSSAKTKDVQKQEVPLFLSKKFLNSQEKVSGKFNENMIYPGLGLQVMELRGKWKGLSLYLEGLLLIDIRDKVYQPRGGVGCTYYF